MKNFFKKLGELIIRFLKANTGVTKALRTFIQVVAGWAISMLPAWLSGVPLPPDIMVVTIALLASIIAAIMSWIASKLPEVPDRQKFADVERG